MSWNYPYCSFNNSSEWREILQIYKKMGNRRDHDEDDDDECFEKYLPILGIVVAVIFIAIFTFVCCRSCKKKRQRRFRSKLLQCFPQIALFMKTLSGIRSHYTTAARAHKGTPTVPNLGQFCKRAHLSTLTLPTPAGSCSHRTACCSRRSDSSACISTGSSEPHAARLQSEL